jgi:hypothetical protein
MLTTTRTLLALPVAAAFVALYAATSAPSEWVPAATQVLDVEVVLDADGLAPGSVTVDLPAMPAEDNFLWELRVRVEGDEARRSLVVSDPNNGALQVQVRDGFIAQRYLDRVCSPDLPCTVVIPLEFEGRPERVEPVRLTVQVGAFDGFALDTTLLSFEAAWTPSDDEG